MHWRNIFLIPVLCVDESEIYQYSLEWDQVVQPLKVIQRSELSDSVHDRIDDEA